jgi:hypothetical protein
LDGAARQKALRKLRALCVRDLDRVEASVATLEPAANREETGLVRPEMAELESVIDVRCDAHLVRAIAGPEREGANVVSTAVYADDQARDLIRLASAAAARENRDDRGER